ncbi:MAG: pyridoxal-dependent decarboxylase [Acidobacteria bacterium]|nr:pyridoxal-dependent decarboxylase [Acidobacteriota bacterium]
MAEPLPRQGQPLATLFAELEQVIVPNSTHTAHPRFLPYVQPSPNALSPYADHVAATLNQNCNLWPLSPAANAVEQVVLRWFADLFGLPASTGGILTSGGSMANFVALTAARDHALGETARTEGLQSSRPPLVLYTSEETHSSIAKAVSMLGLGTRYLRHIPTDEHFRIRLDLLAQAVAEDRAAGLNPFCVVGSAGTVTTGATDPLEALAHFCRQHRLWLHIDGAYGALAALSPRFQPSLAALALADSVSLDPHKFLFCAYEAGCVLVRDRQHLHHAFHAHPSYLTMSEDPDFVDFANHGPQLSRAFKALKVWWSLKHFGADAYAQVIEQMHDLAVYMAEQVLHRPAFELLAPVVFNCVCFRLSALDAAANRRVLTALLDSGTAFLGPASVKDTTGLRACFMNLRTTRADIDRILDHLEHLASQPGW